jgi:hypothetical protein
MRRLHLLTLAVVAGSLGLAACKKDPGGPTPICLAEVAGGVAVESEARELPADVWFSILLSNFDGERRLAGDEPKDCTGSSSIQPTPPPLPEGAEQDDKADPNVVAGCSIAPTDIPALPARPLTDEDVLINKGPKFLGGDTSLIWIQAKHFENGEATGPVAMVQWTKAGVAVRALGTLRAQTNKARMRMEMAGEQQILVVEGDECNTEEKGTCKRIMKLLPNINGRLSTVPLKRVKEEMVGDVDPCLGEAAFALYETYSSDLPDGWVRKFEIIRSVTFDKGNPLVAEQVVIKDKDPKQPDAPPQDFRDASNERVLTYVEAERVFETRKSLWEDVIRDYGSVAHDASVEEE